MPLRSLIWTAPVFGSATRCGTTDATVLAAWRCSATATSPRVMSMSGTSTSALAKVSMPSGACSASLTSSGLTTNGTGAPSGPGRDIASGQLMTMAALCGAPSRPNSLTKRHSSRAVRLTSSRVTLCAATTRASLPCIWSMTQWPSASLSMMKSRLSTLGTRSICSASCSESASSADRKRFISPSERPLATSLRTSSAATRTASSQCSGSAVTLKVVTAQPSRPESLWSSSTTLNGGGLSR
mmetsp:Transcript_2786/g.11153  ORF Transcript_2786/g.11153 Transcript_2786/m.11153 type:complete len:241 (+) Transcript_2786:1650-2372(+)